MRLEAYLEILKPAELRAMAQRLGFKQPDIHRERLSAFICSALRDPVSLRSALKELGEGELAILDYIVTRGLIFFELREVPHLLRHFKLKGDPARPVERLGQLGILFPLEARGYAPFLSVPRELHNEIARFLNDSGHCCPSPAGAPPEIVVSHGLDLLRDLYACLAFMRQEREVRLTQKGTVMKRTHDRLAKGLARSQEDFPLESQLWGLPAFPDRFSLLTGYLLDRGLWQSQRDRWVPGERQAEWLALPYLAQLEDLFAYLYQKYIRRGTGAYQNVNLYLLNALKRFELDRWYPVTALSERLLAYPADGREGLNPDLLSAACQGLLRVLMYLGLVELGGGKGKPRATHFRLSSRYAHVSGLQRLESLGEEKAAGGGLVVQPNFELVVFSEADLSVGLGLARFCELVSADRVAHYRITRESACRAMEEGLTAGEILAFLERYARNEIPQNVRYTLEEWGGHYGEVSFYDVLILETRDAAMAAEIKANKHLARSLCGELSPRHLLVRREAYGLVLNDLKKQGYFPRSQVLKPGEEREADGVTPQDRAGATTTYLGEVEREVEKALRQKGSLKPIGDLKAALSNSSKPPARGEELGEKLQAFRRRSPSFPASERELFDLFSQLLDFSGPPEKQGELGDVEMRSMPFPEMLEFLKGAIEEEEDLAIEYRDPRKGMQYLEIMPDRIVERHKDFYLEAFDLESEEILTLRIKDILTAGTIEEFD